jgi:hypothetical protein
MVHAYDPSYPGGDRRSGVQGQPPEKSMRPYLKNTKVKRAGDFTEVVEHPPSRHEALSSKPSITKKKGITQFLSTEFLSAVTQYHSFGTFTTKTATTSKCSRKSITRKEQLQNSVIN